MSSGAPPHAGSGGPPPPAVLALPHGMVVVGDEAVQRAVVLRLGVNFRATVCSEINAAVEMLRERTKEFDFAVISEESIRSLRPEIMKFLGEETGLRLLVLRNEGGNEYSVVPVVRRSDTVCIEVSHASSARLPAASPHDGSNGSTAAAAAAVASSVRRATNGRKHRRRAGEKSSQHRQRKKRFIWTPELSKIFIEIYEELLLTGINPVPTKILELMKLRIGPMNDPELTRNTVSSYLQKYKAYLLKQEQKDQQLPIDDNTNTSSIKSQQGSASLQQQIMNYGENDSMDNQSIILSQTRYNEHSNKQPKLLTANYHGPRNMHHHHKNTNMQPSNVLLDQSKGIQYVL
ncbi:hypothetical protein OsI_01629 [Oryza sativa Indica Group]|uniref:Uncharacterized protein n=1 Tax=Oryza sativa subsp. indica TaxID=39946 RepID=B8A731_ORYSI|nr:hypothetical protein OsI_01629 [Oryza sativa Indica Group]